MDVHYRIGFRAIKSAIAVFICLLLSYFIKEIGAVYACIAAIICMQPTYSKSVKKGIQRIIGTAIGGIIGYLILYFYQIIPLEYEQLLSVFTIPICLLLVVYFCNVINYKESVQIGCIVLISVILTFETQIGSILLYVFNRVWHTCIGIVIATIINKFLFPNKS